jgi:hypothetical protein
MEWDYAQLVCKVVVPILRLGSGPELIPSRFRGEDFNLLPPELQIFHCPDFRPSRDASEALEELTRILRQPVLEPSAPQHVPALPPRYLPRTEILERVGKALLADAFHPITIDAASKQTAVVRGAAGSGKSVIASSIARSISIRRSFSNGVIWLRFGPQPELRSQFALLSAAAGGSPSQSGLAELISELPELLRDKRSLIVLDDIWRIEDVEPVWNALGAYCRLLITTRDSGIATSLAATECEVGVLSKADSLMLLSQWVGLAAAELPAEARDVARECGHLPLALALCGALVRDKTSWTDLLTALQDADLSFISHELLNYDYPHVLRAMRVSIDFLSQRLPAAPQRYSELAVFWPLRQVPEAAVITLWCRGDGMSARDARQLVAELDRRSLLRLEGQVGERVVWLHDLSWAYVRGSAKDMKSLDAALIAAYEALCDRGWASGPGDGYYFAHLIRHMLRVGRRNDAFELLENPAWLSRELDATDVFSLQEDVERVGAGLEHWAAFLKANAHRLQRHEPEPGIHLLQLAVALPSRDPIRKRAEDYAASDLAPARWVRVHGGHPANEAQRARVLEGAWESQVTVAFSPDGARIVTAGAYLMVWETKSGRLLHRYRR